MTAAQARTRGREFFDQRAWGDAFTELSAADREVPLEPEDLGRLATAAYLVGRDERQRRAVGARASGAAERG